MELTSEERAHFQHVFHYPTDAQIQALTPDQFPRFIYYLYERDGLYTPIYVDGPGDGGVDLELRAQNGASPALQGVVQCKRYLRRKVRPRDLVDFIEAARKSEVDRRYYFTTRGYTPAARRDARLNSIIPFDAPAIRDWIHDIERREKRSTQTIADLPHRDQVPIPIICVANHKGGVSKTTITGNLAAALASSEQGVLVICAHGRIRVDLRCHARVLPEAPSTPRRCTLTRHCSSGASWPLLRPFGQPSLVEAQWPPAKQRSGADQVGLSLQADTASQAPPCGAHQLAPAVTSLLDWVLAQLQVK